MPAWPWPWLRVSLHAWELRAQGTTDWSAPWAIAASGRREGVVRTGEAEGEAGAQKPSKEFQEGGRRSGQEMQPRGQKGWRSVTSAGPPEARVKDRSGRSVGDPAAAGRRSRRAVREEAEAEEMI